MTPQMSSEPFPPLSAHGFISTQDSSTLQADSTNETPGQRLRRRSSSLRGDPRGDTGARALATITNQKEEPSREQLNRTRSNTPQKPLPRRGQKGYKRRKAKSFFRRWKSISLRHTWLNPLVVVLILLGAYLVQPGPQNPLHRAIFLSYSVPGTSPLQYGKGGNDFAFVAFYTVVLSFTREFLMQRLIRPTAIACGIHARAKQSRFMEQAYTALYFGVSGPFGLYVLYRSPVWYFNTHGMFEGFPHRQHEGLFKAYYLLQAAYWTQQFLVLALQLEKPRKDFKELVAHHITTIALIWCSYRFHFAQMGVVVFVTHDISDFFLAISKMSNYLDLAITAPLYVFFIFVWAYCRHYINLRLLYAVATDFRYVGPFELNWDTQQYKCWISQYITFALLAALQALNLFWFFLILRIAKRMALDSVIEDQRSEADEEDDEGSTQEKRERMNWPAVAEKPGKGQFTNGDLGTPTVLLNGHPVEVSDGTAGLIARSTGRKSVEIKAQERRKVVR